MTTMSSELREALWIKVFLAAVTGCSTRMDVPKYIVKDAQDIADLAITELQKMCRI